MKIENDEKRLFFGAEVVAPWSETYPSGRILEEAERHITLAFLGNVPYHELVDQLATLPKPHFKIGPVGKCNELLFIPNKVPRVAAFHIEWLHKKDQLSLFQKQLLHWLDDKGYEINTRKFLSHVTIARAPIDKEVWEESFVEMPIYIKAIHLYESVGNLEYVSRWQIPLVIPFEEIEHTADLAFHIHGEDFPELYLHACLALSFHYLPIFFDVEERNDLKSIDDVVAALNELISKVDSETGVPFKAVSYHGDAKKVSNNLLFWKMIVDV